MSDVLERICVGKRAETAARAERVPLRELERRIARREPPRGFAAQLRKAAHGHDGFGVIAEIKKASPSKGLIRADFDPAELARAYAAGGASCLSVLTDTPSFMGRDEDLETARAAVDLPVLRKDFILDAYQVHETAALGADCLLLIMAALTDGEAIALADLAKGLGLDILVEVHDETELERALALPADLVGINNRNLKTLAVDLAVSETLAPRVPDDRLIVAESGIASFDEIERLMQAGARAFLVGESLMREEDVTIALLRLRGRDMGL